MPKVLKAGILGQGRSGYDIHLAGMQAKPEKFRVVAVADLIRGRRKEARELGAKTYGDYRELLADRDLDLDFVVNALPSHLHPRGNIDVLNSGYHVVGEKPAAKTVKQFDEVVAAARRNRRRYLPFQNSRFQPVFEKMLEVLDSGVLGKPVYIRSNWSSFARRWDWQTLQAYWGGNLLNTGPHPLDQAIVLYGAGRPKVFARMVSENPFGDADNLDAVTLCGGKDKPTIEIVLNSFQAYPQGDLYNISATCGGLTATLTEMRWKYFDPRKAPKQRQAWKWSDKRSYCGEKLDWVEKNWSVPKGMEPFVEIRLRYYDHLHDVLANGARPRIKLSEVRRQVGVLEECFRQNRLPRKKKPKSAV